jgi:quercetin dioxygenase-like cupin family protein
MTPCKSGKVWGETTPIIVRDSFEVHRIRGLAGGYSSVHSHQYKYNLFYVDCGKMCIRVWRDNLCDTTILQRGESTIIEPNLRHQMEFLQDTVAYEIYWPREINNDIIRYSQGGTKTNGTQI